MWLDSNIYIDQTCLGNKMNNAIVHSWNGPLETNGSRLIVQAWNEDAKIESRWQSEIQW
jgi:hypothetical protein